MSDHESFPVVMVVDDLPVHLQLLENMLVSSNYRVLLFAKAELALKAAEKTPPDIVLMDINMPEMDGYQLCECFKTTPHLKDIPIIFISSLSETTDKIKAFAVGGVDYISKPYQLEEVLARIGTHLKLRTQQIDLKKYNNHLEDLVQAQVQEISKSQIATIAALAKLAESRDDDSGFHIERVRLYSNALAVALGKSSPYKDEITATFIESLYYGSPLHDIGKVTIADSILLKPDKLSAEEFETMKRHTLIGAKTLASIHAKYPKNAFIRAALNIARSHHERWDGSGYPDGSSGTEIPLYARIVAIADVYDSLRSNKCYRTALEHSEVCTIIVEGGGTQFDPHVIEVFQQISDEFLFISEETDM